MLIHIFSAQSQGDYRKTLKARRILFFAASVMGLISIALPVGLMAVLPDINALAMGFYTGIGLSVLGMGIFGVYTTGRTLRNENRLRTELIKESDERKQEITRRAAVATTLITVFVFWAALMVSVMLNRVVYYTLVGFFFSFVLIFMSCSVYYGKKL